MAKKQIGRPVDVEKRDRFLHWWALPKTERNPATIGEWCQANDVAHTTTWRWRDDPKFKGELLKLRMGPAEDHLTDIIEGLTAKAVQGEVQQAKLLLEMLGAYRNVSEVIHKDGEDGAYTPEIIEFLAEEMLAHEKMPDMNIDDLKVVLTDTLG